MTSAYLYVSSSYSKYELFLVKDEEIFFVLTFLANQLAEEVLVAVFFSYQELLKTISLSKTEIVLPEKFKI